ncbi:Mitochondrial chaperone BCS1 [Mycena kentingensis (nom. inval.)]|nr:Mitochondrial chaperone BCS1 [Mycena kentingensis (nom. inval.)]
MKIGRFTPQLYTSRSVHRPGKKQSRDAAPAPSSSSVPNPSSSRPPRKKALLIGISYGGADDASASPGLAPLKGPHGDVKAMYKLIVDRYGYRKEDVVVLLDDGEGTVPSRVNILKAIDDLVQDAIRGDRFFFHYCGHTIQVENRSNSEEDGMDECLVPADGESNKIMDNELRRHLVDGLPVGSSLVAVFDSCHSASLLDLAHFRCNRVYVPWMNKGKRRSDDRWNAVVRKHALPLLPLSKPATPANSPPVSRAPTLPDLSVFASSPAVRSPLAPRAIDSYPAPLHDRSSISQPPQRRITRRAAREIRELIQLNASVPLPGSVPYMDGLGLVTTRPASPAPATAPTSPIVTTRRIYEAARTSSRRVQAWRTEVDALEMDVVAEDDAELGVEPLSRAGTDGDLRKRKKLAKALAGTQIDKGKRASLPPVPLRPPSLAPRANQQREESTRQRRTTVSRARAVSVSVRDSLAGKENAGSVAGERPSLKVAVPDPARPASWFGEDRECDSPAPVWPCDGHCRDRAHGHDLEESEAEVISLASCKDSQLSWEDENGGSMTSELVRILDRDPHPTLRALLAHVSFGLHRMSLHRHVKTRAYKHDLKAYNEWLHTHGGRRGKTPAGQSRGLDPAPAPTLASVSRASTLSLATPNDPDTAVTSVGPSFNFGDGERLSIATPPRQPQRRKATCYPLEIEPSLPSAPLVQSKSDGLVAYDMDNFQDPQLASHRPLDMSRPWIM